MIPKILKKENNGDKRQKNCHFQSLKKSNGQGK
jgi:hypothetical protein